MLYDNYTDYMIATSYVTMLYDNYIVTYEISYHVVFVIIVKHRNV